MNGRNLEVRFRGPPGFDALERVAREAAQARFQRGQVNVSLQARRAEAAGAAQVNRELLERYLDARRRAGRRGPRGCRRPPTACLALRGVIEIGEEDEAPEARAAVEAAMAGEPGRRRWTG